MQISKFLQTIRSKYQDMNNFRIILFLLIFSLSAITIRVIKVQSVDAHEIQEGIASEIIRFHVLANSDSKEDQALKLIVKEALVKELSPVLSKAQNIDEARSLLSEKLSLIKELAEEVISENGYSYSATVALEQCSFPLKIYGDYTFPPGTYEALRVQIGEAKGQNWWCVMYPPLCFVDATYSIVPDESESQLKYLLTEEEYRSIKGQKVPVKIKFKVLEYFKKLFG